MNLKSPLRNPSAPADPDDPIPLTESPPGFPIRLHSTGLASKTTALVASMGLVVDQDILVRRQGEPVVVQIGATRIGLARTVAAQIFVHRPDFSTETT